MITTDQRSKNSSQHDKGKDNQANQRQFIVEEFV
jgi:hypothetical protein